MDEFLLFNLQMLFISLRLVCFISSEQNKQPSHFYFGL